MITKFATDERKEIAKLAHLTLTTEDSPDVEEALDYLKNKRGLTDEAIEKYQFGYIPNRLREHDWRGRVIMPLYDQYEELVVLTSRDFRTTQKEKRPHLHEQFNKKRYLYGLDVAKEHIIKHNSCIIVEGQFDTTRLHVNGLLNTVGVLGSAFTFNHICALRKYCQNFYLLFDNDKSGKKNIQRAIELYNSECLGSEAFDTRFYPVFFDSKYKDPDELIVAKGIGDLRESLLDAHKNRLLNLEKIRLWQ